MIKERIEIISKRLEIAKVKFLAFSAGAGWIWNFLATEVQSKPFYVIISVFLLLIFSGLICFEMIVFIQLNKTLKMLE